MTCSRIYGLASNVACRIMDAITPKSNQKVGFLTDAAAAAVTAITATVDPIFAVQLAGTYLCGRAIHNAGVGTGQRELVIKEVGEDEFEVDPDQRTPAQRLAAQGLSPEEIRFALNQH